MFRIAGANWKSQLRPRCQGKTCWLRVARGLPWSCLGCTHKPAKNESCATSHPLSISSQLTQRAPWQQYLRSTNTWSYAVLLFQTLQYLSRELSQIHSADAIDLGTCRRGSSVGGQWIYCTSNFRTCRQATWCHASGSNSCPRLENHHGCDEGISLAFCVCVYIYISWYNMTVCSPTKTSNTWKTVELFIPQTASLSYCRVVPNIPLKDLGFHWLAIKYGMQLQASEWNCQDKITTKIQGWKIASQNGNTPATFRSYSYSYSSFSSYLLHLLLLLLILLLLLLLPRLTLFCPSQSGAALHVLIPNKVDTGSDFKNLSNKMSSLK